MARAAFKPFRHNQINLYWINNLAGDSSEPSEAKETAKRPGRLIGRPGFPQFFPQQKTLSRTFLSIGVAQNIPGPDKSTSS